MGDVALSNIFAIPEIDGRSIPPHKKFEYRARFGNELHLYYRESAVRDLKKIAKRAMVSKTLLTNLFAGKDTHDQATIERLHRIATTLSCELILRDAEGEKHCGASTTFEELLRMGIWPALERISDSDQ
jgi:transcriptional regulator with XRE-family HTH domain